MVPSSVYKTTGIMKKMRKKMEMTEILCRYARRPMCVTTARIFDCAIWIWEMAFTEESGKSYSST